MREIERDWERLYSGRANDVPMADTDRLVHALVGAAVSLVLAFLPFAPILGGGVAGYLEGGDLRNGAVVGGLSGLLAAIPLAFLFALAAGFLLIVPVGIGVPSRVAVLGGLFLVALVAAAVYTVSLGALGGVLGAYLAEELDREG